MRTLDEGIRIRADEKTVRLIDRAAELAATCRSAFVRDAALAEARRIIQAEAAKEPAG